MENFHQKLAKTTLLLPALSVGNIGTLTLDLLIKNNEFKRIAYFKTKALQPTIGRLPDILKSEEKALALPGEIYFNENITILQIRSHVKENGLKDFLKDIENFIEIHSFESVIVVGSTSCKARPDFEINSLGKNVYFLTNEQIKSNQFDLSKLFNIEKLVNKAYEEKVSELFVGSGIIPKMLKKKEFKKFPLLFLMIYSGPGEDFNGSCVMCRTLGEILPKKEIKPFSETDYVLPKYFLI